jgi:hypothetical protein
MVKKIKGNQELENKLVGAFGEMPAGLNVISRNRIRLTVDDGWQGVNSYTITPEDVIYYYYRDARNITSGCRSVGNITDDWRMIDSIAKTLLEVYKIINRPAMVMVKEGEKYGMTLKT